MLQNSVTGDSSLIMTHLIMTNNVFRYPNIEMNHDVEDPEDAKTGNPTIVNVTLEREDELQGNVIGESCFMVTHNW